MYSVVCLGPAVKKVGSEAYLNIISRHCLAYIIFFLYFSINFCFNTSSPNQNIDGDAVPQPGHFEKYAYSNRGGGKGERGLRRNVIDWGRVTPWLLRSWHWCPVMLAVEVDTGAQMGILEETHLRKSMLRGGNEKAHLGKAETGTYLRDCARLAQILDGAQVRKRNRV